MSKFELETLMTVWQLRAGAYGVSIAEQFKKRTGHAPSPGKLYTVLEKLTKDGLLETEMGEPTRARGGRRKRFYRITGAGQLAAEHSMNRLITLGDGLELPGMGGVAVWR